MENYKKNLKKEKNFKTKFGLGSRLRVGKILAFHNVCH